MRVKKKRKFQRGGGVFTNPSGTEIPSGWGVKTKKPSVGGVWIFSGTAHCFQSDIFKGKRYENCSNVL